MHTRNLKAIWSLVLSILRAHERRLYQVHFHGNDSAKEMHLMEKT